MRPKTVDDTFDLPGNPAPVASTPSYSSCSRDPFDFAESLFHSIEHRATKDY
jgi:hypothetical protein